jgi:predicted deacylase
LIPEITPRGRNTAVTLEVETPTGTVPLDVLLARGAQPGPTLAATAAVHGDEYEGVRTLFEIFAELNPAAMSGALLAVPVANSPAFWNMSRCSPFDGENLARAFPGRSAGSATEALAFALDQAIFAHADFFIDLHSAGVRYVMPTMAGYHRPDRRSREAAFCFGAPVVWGHDNIGPGAPSLPVWPAASRSCIPRLAAPAGFMPTI